MRAKKTYVFTPEQQKKLRDAAAVILQAAEAHYARALRGVARAANRAAKNGFRRKRK